VAVRCMPKSLTEVICSIPDREAGEMKLRAPGRLKTGRPMVTPQLP